MSRLKLAGCVFAMLSFPFSGVYGQQAVLEKARALAGDELYADAVALLERVPADSMTAGGWYRLGTYYQALIQHEKAIEVLEQADTTDTRVLAALGRSLEALGRMREAGSYYAAAYAADSTAFTIAVSLANVHMDLGEWVEVKEIYRDLVRRDETNPFTQAQLGQAYRMLDSTDHAIVHLERARRLNPLGLKVVLQLTAVYLNNGYPSSARQVVNATLPLMPDEPLLWERAGDVGMKEEDYTWAAKAYRNALALGDTTVVSLRNLGLALYLTQAYPEAVQLFEQAYEADSTDKLNTFYLGMAHQRLEQYEEALFYFEQAKALMGAAALADISTQVGVALDALDRTGEAVAAFDLSLRLDEKERDALFYLARLYDKRGSTEAARSYYSEFLSSGSEDEMPQFQNLARERLTALQAAGSPEFRVSAAADTLASDSTSVPE